MIADAGYPGHQEATDAERRSEREPELREVDGAERVGDREPEQRDDQERDGIDRGPELVSELKIDGHAGAPMCECKTFLFRRCDGSTMTAEGDPRVLFVLNLVLSFLFSTAVVGGLDFLGAVPFEWSTVGVATLALMVLSYLVVLR